MSLRDQALDRVGKVSTSSAKFYVTVEQEKNVYKGLAEGKVSGRVVLDIPEGE